MAERLADLAREAEILQHIDQDMKARKRAFIHARTVTAERTEVSAAPAAAGADASLPHHKLAELVRKDMGVAVPPETLRLFLLANWRKISRLAHTIHEEADAADD